MASLGNSIINGRLRVINETNTGALTVNGSSVSLLSGNIKDNTSSTAVVSAKQVADYITSQTVTPKFDGGGISGGGLTPGAGSASAVGTGITLGTVTTTRPSSGYYITVTGSGTVSRAAITTSNVLYNGAVNGWVNVADNTKALDGKSSAATSASSNTATVYYPITAGSITNNTSGGTSTATINRGKQIKIGAGYYPSDLYYTAQGAPTLSGNATAAQVLSGKTFYSSSYTKQTGTMANNGATGGTITTQGGTYTIPAGYTSGGTVTANIGTGTYSASGTAGTGSMSGRVVTIPFTPKATINTAGYIAKGSTNGTAVNGTYTVAAGGYSASGTAGLGSNDGATVTIPFTPTATGITGYIEGGSKDGVVVNGKYTMPPGIYSASASHSVTPPSVAVSGTTVGFTASSSATSYYVKVSGTPTDGSVTATATAKIDTAGYLATGSTSDSTLPGTITPSITGNNGKVYIPAGSYSASGTAGTGYIDGNVVTIPFTPKATIDTAGYIAKGNKEGTVVNGTYEITTGTVTQPTATQENATASLSGTTITLSKSVTPNVTTAGIISTGTAGTVTLQGTVPTQTKTATTSGDVKPDTGKLLSKVSVPAATPKFTGGTVSGGDLSGGDLSITTNYSGTPTVTVSDGSDTNMTNIIVGSRAQSGYPYYFKVSGASSALSGTTKATRAAVARTAVKRAAVTYNGAVDGWVEVNSGVTALDKNDTAIAANDAVIAAKSVEPTVTVNAGSGSTYVGIKAAVITNGFVTGAGYIPDDDTAAYKTQYNATDDCVDILFN